MSQIVRMRGEFTSLVELINEITDENDKITMVEIGSYAGESAEGFLSSGRVGRIFCVDTRKPHFDARLDAEVEAAFDERHANDSRVIKINGDVSAFADRYERGEFGNISIDLVYIDACHAYDCVRNDISVTLSRIKPIRAIAGHDYNWKSVHDAVSSILGDAHKIFKDTSCKDTSWLIRLDVAKLYVVTPTGDRPDAFKRCIDYVNRQTRKPDKWLIVDDGTTDVVYEYEDEIEVPHEIIRLPSLPGYTAIRNLRAAFEFIPEDANVCIVYDDDWYPPTYLAEMSRLLEDHAVVASRDTHYYNVRTRQYRILNNRTSFPMYGYGFAREGLSGFRAFIQKTNSMSADTHFSESWKGDRVFNDDHRVIHITGFGRGRRGTTSSHVIAHGTYGWEADDSGETLRTWVGSDAEQYLSESDREQRGKIYVISNVRYSEERKIHPDPDDLLVFLNHAISLPYYKDHKNKVIFRRSDKDEYVVEDDPTVEQRYVYGPGSVGIPSEILQEINNKYDWAYTLPKDWIKSPTTGFFVIQYLSKLYPQREIVLVNFGYTVATSTMRSDYHNWAYEAHALSRFRHVFTADTKADESAQAPDIHVRSEFEARVATIFNEEKDTRTNKHSYGEIYAQQLGPLVGRKARIVELAAGGLSGLRAFSRILPDAAVSGIQLKPDLRESSGFLVVTGSGYRQEDWSEIQGEVDLIVDTGARSAENTVDGLSTLLSHLKTGGVLLLENVRSEADVSLFLERLPHAVCCRTLPTGEQGDDRVIVYRHAPLP